MVVSRKAHELGKLVFTTVKTEFHKKSEISTTSIYWKLQTVSSCVDLMVWTIEQDDQGDNINFDSFRVILIISINLPWSIMNP